MDKILFKRFVDFEEKQIRCVQKILRLKLYLSRQKQTINEINFLQNSPLVLQHTYSCKSSIE